MQTDTIKPDLDSDDRYCDLLALMQENMDRIAASMPTAHVFTTDANVIRVAELRRTGIIPALSGQSTRALYEQFLVAVSEGQPARRQHYDCRTCRRFVEQYGHLVFVDADGRQVPAVWPEAIPWGPLGRAAALVYKAVSRAKVTGVYCADAVTLSEGAPPASWGPRFAGARADGELWSHMSVTPPIAVDRATRSRNARLTGAQVSAERLQDHGILTRSLADFSRATVAEALGYLRAGQLYRSEVAEQIAAWLLALHDALAVTQHEQHRRNLVWRAVATAPAGFCHVRSSMLGTLLEDIDARLPFPEIARRWSAKMDPTKYQRPQAPPTEGNLRRAEVLFEQLGLAPALRRRHARLSDLRLLWSPSFSRVKDTGRTSTKDRVFAHLSPRPGAAPPTRASGPVVKITFDKFRRTVLPTAVSIEFAVPDGKAPFAALVTAVDPDAPPIVQWDREHERNSVTWYVHSNGNPASEWGLRAHTLVKVTGICLSPNLWRDEADPVAVHNGRKAFVLLEGARERPNRRGGGLFPSLLRGDLREIRATIEAHAQSARVEESELGDACGLMLQEGVPWRCELHVVDRTGAATRYSLDRWD